MNFPLPRCRSRARRRSWEPAVILAAIKIAVSSILAVACLTSCDNRSEPIPNAEDWGIDFPPADPNDSNNEIAGSGSSPQGDRIHPKDAPRILQFEGGNGYVEVEQGANLFDLNRDFTIEVWLRITRYYEGMTILGDETWPEMKQEPRPERAEGWALGGGSEPSGVYSLKFTAAESSGEQLTLTGPSINFGWHHVAVVRSRDELTLYHDGVAADSTPADEMLVPSDSLLCLGTHPLRRHDKFFQGELRDFHITQRAKYSEPFEPAESTQVDDDSALLFDFTRTGNRLHDLSENGHDGMPNGWHDYTDLVFESRRLARRGNFQQAFKTLDLPTREAAGVARRHELFRIDQRSAQEEYVRLSAELAYLDGQFSRMDILRKNEWIETAEAIFEADSLDMADVLEGKGNLLLEECRFEESRQALERALEIRSAKLPDDSLLTARLLLALGSLYEDIGEPKKALLHLNRALAIHDGHERQDANVIHVLVRLGRLKESLGKYADAVPFYDDAQQAAEAQGNTNHTFVGHLQMELGRQAVNQRQFDLAFQFYDRALKIYEGRAGDQIEMRARIAYARALLTANRYEEVEELLTPIEEQLGYQHDLRLDLIDGWLLAADFRSNLGQYQEAIARYGYLLRRVHNQYPNYPILQAQILNRGGWVYHEIGRADASVAALERCLEINESVYGDNSGRLTSSLSALGQALLAAGRVDDAERVLRRYAALVEQVEGADTYNFAVSRATLAMVYFKSNNLERARNEFERSLAILKKIEPDGENRQIVNLHLTATYRLMGERGLATELVERGMRGYIDQIRRHLPFLGQSEQINFISRSPKTAMLGEGVRLAVSGDDAALVAKSAEWHLNSKSLMIETLAQQNILARESKDDETRNLRYRLIRLQMFLSLFSTMQPDGRPDSLYSLLPLYRSETNRISHQLGRAIKDLLPKQTWLKIDDVRAALPKGSIFIDFAIIPIESTENRRMQYFAWVIPPVSEGQIELIDLGDAGAMNQLIQSFRTINLNQGFDEELVGESLRRVSDRLLKPLEDRLHAAEHWIISPDQQLWLMPFVALLLKDDQYVVERHRISYVTTGRELLAAPQTAAAAQPLVLANPDYDRGRPVELHGSGRFTPLPGTSREANLIAPSLRRYAGVDPIVLTEASASERAVRSFKSPVVLMLSTHGFYGGRFNNPLLNCGLALAGANLNKASKKSEMWKNSLDDDGILTGLDILGLDLRGTRLAVLSACETGLGELAPGEGVSGLQQAFLLAGADSVVATLWPIPDDETAELMGSFFERLAIGSDYPTALREAQLELIRNRREGNKGAAPFFWAAFTLTGRWNDGAAKSTVPERRPAIRVEDADRFEARFPFRPRFSADGSLGIFLDLEKLAVWDVETRRIVGKSLPNNEQALQGFASNADASSIYVLERDKLGKFDFRTGSVEWLSEKIEGKSCSIALSADGKQLLVSGRFGQVQLWDVKQRRFVRQYQGIEKMAHAVAFSPNGKYVVAAESPMRDYPRRPTDHQCESLVCWNRISGELLWRRNIDGPFSLMPRSEMILVGSAPLVEFVDSKTGKTVDSFDTHMAGILDVLVPNDEQWIVLVGNGGEIRIVESKSRHALQHITTHRGTVSNVLSRDGRWMMSCGQKAVILREIRGYPLAATRE